MKLQLAAYATPTGVQLEDWSHLARDVQFTTNEHGFATLTAFIPLRQQEALLWYDRPGLPWIEVYSSAGLAWKGRLEDVSLVTGGIRIGALGAWSAFGDIPYTATPAPPTQADVVLEDMLADIVAANPTMLNATTVLIQAPGFDLFDEEFVDADMRRELTRMATLGDGTDVWEVGVWEWNRVHLRPRGSAGRTWYVDAAELDVERSLSQVWNSTYTTYNSGASTTATVTDAASVSRYGVVRRKALTSRTTDAGQAADEASAWLADYKDAKPRASVAVTAVFDATGYRWPLFLVRSGDKVVLRNLPLGFGDSLDRIATFIIAETRYSCDADTLEITPESPPPRLDVLLARREEATV